MQSRPTRRGLARLLGALGAGGLATLTEPYRPQQVEQELALRDLPPSFDGLRVALLADLHLQRAFPAVALAPGLALAAAARPDLLLLVGDYCWDRESGQAATLSECAALLAPLAQRCPLGAFCVFGNHDFPEPPADPDRGPWEAAGIRPLLDEAVALRRGGEHIYLVGMRSAISRPVSPVSVLAQAPSGACRIALWHEPDRAPEVQRGGASLLLCGHTHGGQLALPGLGPLRLPVLGQRYPGGLYWLGPMPLYVTRGLGVLPPRLRFCCPPEVTLLTLRRAA